MSKHSPWLGIQSEHEQDFEHAIDWWRQASEEDKLTVWFGIQDMKADVLPDLIARFAQLGFEAVALKESLP